MSLRVRFRLQSLQRMRVKRQTKVLGKRVVAQAKEEAEEEEKAEVVLRLLWQRA